MTPPRRPELAVSCGWQPARALGDFAEVLAQAGEPDEVAEGHPAHRHTPVRADLRLDSRLGCSRCAGGNAGGLGWVCRDTGLPGAVEDGSSARVALDHANVLVPGEKEGLHLGKRLLAPHSGARPPGIVGVPGRPETLEK